MKHPDIAKLPFGIEYRRLIPPSQRRPRRYAKHWETWNWFATARERDALLDRLRRREIDHEFRPIMRRSEVQARQRFEEKHHAMR